MSTSCLRHTRLALATLLFVVSVQCGFAQPEATNSPIPKPELTLSRPVRAWEFMPAVGQKAGLFGHETGVIEAWVYPMKLVRDLSLVFHVNGRVIPAAS